jgi:hypothetical protein
MNQSLDLGSNESLLPTASGSSWNDLEDVESHGFRQGPVEDTDNKYLSNKKGTVSNSNRQDKTNALANHIAVVQSVRKGDSLQNFCKFHTSLISREYYLHWPMMTWSPSLIRKHGEM